MNNLLSVVVPVYNSGKFLERCLDSILKQNYPYIEVLVVDDGSTDNSRSIIEFFLSQDPRVKAIYKQNGGQSSARNAALNIASGDFITFVDSDDSVSIDIYECMYLFDICPDVDIVQFPCIAKYGTKEEELKYCTSVEIRGKENLYYSWLLTRQISNYVCNKIFRRIVFKDICFREGMIYEDRYLMADVLQICRSVKIIKEGRYFYYDHPQQTTKKQDDYSNLSKLLADLNIVKHIFYYHSLIDEWIERYNNCLFYYSQVRFKNLKVRKEIEKDLKNYTPTIWVVLLSKNALGIKVRLLRRILCGLSIFSNKR